MILGWLGNVTIGAWFLDTGALTITVVLVALLLARAEADPEQPMQLPVPAAFVIVVLVAIAALEALLQVGDLIGAHQGIQSWLDAARRRRGRRPRARRRGPRGARVDQGWDDLGSVSLRSR